MNASTTKEKSRHRHQSTTSSQQTTLPMSHSPTSKSQMYYESPNGQGKSSGNRSNGRSTQESSATGPGAPYSRSSYAERAYSLPRQAHHYQQSPAGVQPSGYYTHDRRATRQGSRDREREREEERRHRQDRDRDSGYDRSRDDPRQNGGSDTPDFYFMPSQRKYSGEVVRVYVDYNKDPKH